MTFTAVGSLIDQASGSFTLTPSSASGDFIMLAVANFSNNTVFASSVSSSNATWTAIGHRLGSPSVGTVTLFIGTVTSASAATLTVTWSGTAPAGILVEGREFHSTAGAWNVDASNFVDSASTAVFPSITPAASGELYWGYAEWLSGAANSGSTSGYTYQLDTNGNGSCYNLNCSGSAQAPAWGSPDNILGFAAMISETAAAPAAVALPRRALGKSRVPNRYKPVMRALFTVPAPSGTPLAGIPDSPALILASAVPQASIAGLTGTPAPAIELAAPPAQAAKFDLPATAAPAVTLDTAISAAAALGLTAIPAPAVELETSPPAAGKLGLTGTAAPAVELPAALPASGTLAVITALNGTPPPAVTLEVTPALSAGAALVGIPAPALELHKTQPATGLLGLAGTPPPALTLQTQRPAAGIYALAGTPAPAALLDLANPANGGSTVTGTTRTAITLLGAVPAIATLAVPPPIVYGRAHVHTGLLADSEPGTGTPAAAMIHTGTPAAAMIHTGTPAAAAAHTGGQADATVRGDT